MLQTDQQFRALAQHERHCLINPDTSVDIWFGPTAPEGHKTNWLQTVPGKGWLLSFACMDHSILVRQDLAAGEIELVK